MELTTWKYTSNKISIHQKPDVSASIIGEINQFEDVRVYVNKGTARWDFIDYDYLKGFVLKEQLVEGSGENAYIQYCRSLGGDRPENGSSLMYSVTGPHTLIVINPPGNDAAIKLRDMDDRESLFYYIHGGQTLKLNNVPDGEFQFSYATGKNFSSACGRFLDEMRAWEADGTVTFRMEKSGLGERPVSESYSLKNQFAINVPVETRKF